MQCNRVSRPLGRMNENSDELRENERQKCDKLNFVQSTALFRHHSQGQTERAIFAFCKDIEFPFDSVFLVFFSVTRLSRVDLDLGEESSFECFLFLSFQLSPANAGRGMFCYHCPPSIHPAGPHPPRLPSLDYPFAPTHPCKFTANKELN